MRRSILLLFAAFCALAALTRPAGASVASSAITNPGDPLQRTFDLSDGKGPLGVRVDGKATFNSTGSTVDIRCFAVDNAVSGVLGTATVDASGTFTAYVDASTLTGPCVLRALPSGTLPTSLALFTGPRIYPSGLTDARIQDLSSPNAGTRDDIYDHVVTPDRATSFALGSLGGCGLYFARPLDPGGDPSQPALNAFNCAGYADFTADGTPQSRSDIEVDGRDAFTGGMLADSQTTSGNGAVMDRVAGMPGLDATRSLDAGGTYSLDEGSDVVRCQSTLPSFPPVNAAAAAACGGLVDSGVRYTRHVQSSDDGRVVTVTDRWRSTDGAAHRLDLLLEQDMESTSYGLDVPWVTGTAFKSWPGTASLPPAPSAPGTILVRSDAARPDVTTAAPAGALVYGTAPDGVEFYDDGQPTSRYPQLHYVRTVPASGDLVLAFVYVIGSNLDTVRALAARSEDRLAGPAVSLSAPSTTSVPTVTVTGTASDNGAVAGVTVNGQPAPLAAGGTWSATVPLSLGANTVTAQATDDQGNTAQASIAVTYAPPATSSTTPSPARGQCVVPSVLGLRRTSAQRKLEKANCRLGQVVYAYVRARHYRKGRKRITVFYTRGTIVSQRIKPGSKVAAATPVRIHIQSIKPRASHAHR